MHALWLLMLCMDASWLDCVPSAERPYTSHWLFNGPLTTEPMGAMRGAAHDFYSYLPPLEPRKEISRCVEAPEAQEAIEGFSLLSSVGINMDLGEYGQHRARIAAQKWYTLPAPLLPSVPINLARFNWPDADFFTITGSLWRPYETVHVECLLHISDLDDRVRLDVANRLGRCNEGWAGDALVRLLREDPSGAVRAEAARSLARRREVWTTSALKQAAASDRDPEVRKLAEIAVWLIDEPLHFLPPRWDPLPNDWGGGRF